MARAGVPTNRRVLPPAELAPSEWAAGAPRLQPYQETVSRSGLGLGLGLRVGLRCGCSPTRRL
eukprot:scaffold105613_cov42-Phaeocystis_antarctica.AAC.1